VKLAQMFQNGTAVMVAGGFLGRATQDRYLSICLFLMEKKLN
jgi:hypothetical protein